jgi:hypothetical protein
MPIAVTLILAAAALLGVYLGVLYLRGAKRPNVLSAIHLLLGVGGLEFLSIVYRLRPGGAVMRSEAFLPTAGLLFALAVLSGFTKPMIGRRWPKSLNWILSLHAAAGLAGLAFIVAWAANW